MNPVNFFLKLFGLKFSDPNIESEYIKTRSPLTKNFLKHLIIVSLFFLIWSIGKAIYNGTRYIPNANPFLLILCLVLLKYYDKYPALMEVMIVLISCALYGIGLVAIRIYMGAGYGAVLFYVGYNSSLFQRLIETRFMKTSSIALLYFGFFVLRVVIMSEWTFYALMVQLMLEILLMVSNLERERQIRRLFQSFYDYRQGLFKFKHLITNHFPENIIIFNKTLSQTLFINDSFQKSFSCKDMIETKQFIDTLAIDIETFQGLELLGELTSNSVKATYRDPYVVLRAFSDAKNITSNQIFSFNVRTKYEEKLKAVFQTKLLKLPWDQEEAVAMIFSDLTQQETIMSLRLSDSNKDKVIATVSHELRTPINAILGFIKILEGKNFDEMSHFYMTACKYSANWLLTLVNSILDLSQIRGNCIKISPNETNLAEILDEIKKMFSFQCSQKNLRLIFDIARDLPRSIYTDKNRLKQILINLLNNAFKFTFNGSITLKAQNDPNDPRKLLFSIQDTGIGIKREDIEKLFKMYGRVDQANQNINTQGVGLGLTICQELVRLLNPRSEMAQIDVQSEFEKGTTFTFSISKNLVVLPEVSSLNNLNYLQSTTEIFELDDLHALPLPADKGYKFMPDIDSTSSQSESTVSSSDKSQKLYDDTADTETGPWTLLVDDMPFNLIVATHFLKKRGYNVKTALNGQEAIQAVEDHVKLGKEFKFILMDCQMPVMDGYEATRTLVAMMRSQIIPKTPIIAFSANNAQRDVVNATNCGMSGFLFKPFDEEQLVKILLKLNIQY